MTKLSLSREPDGLGYHYGQWTDDAGNSTRINVLPPRSLWRGDTMPAGISNLHFIIYADGEEIARVTGREDISDALSANLLPSP